MNGYSELVMTIEAAKNGGLYQRNLKADSAAQLLLIRFQVNRLVRHDLHPPLCLQRAAHFHLHPISRH